MCCLELKVQSTRLDLLSIKMKTFISILFFISSLSIWAQGGFSPAVGEPGCNAIYKDSSLIKSWANACTVDRGYQNILKPSLGKVSVGDSSKAIGIADNIVVSLGDRGTATLTFNGELFNGPGYDFAVFENGFDNYFLELAFVEVSSDGQNFFRFPSESLTDTSNQVSTFDSLDATNLYNLAGKYRSNYGVPFDLEEMKGIVGLDVDKVTHVKIIDVVGSMNNSIASRDSKSVKVNDPFPTAFPSGGFDLDAVAAIHIKPTGINENRIVELGLYPNPTQGEINFNETFQNALLNIYSLDGRLVRNLILKGSSIDLSNLNPSIYFIQIQTETTNYQAKVLIE